MVMATLKLFHIAVFLALFSTLARSEDVTNSRKLDDATPSEFENKCGGCPCNNPCNPTPSPPPPSPPPPSLPPPPPPTPQKPPPSNYCPPPPAAPSGGSQFPPNPPYIFINGPPQDLYPVDSNFSGSCRIISTGLIPFLISWVVGLIIALWW